MRPLVVDSPFLHLFAVDSLDVLTLRNSFVRKTMGESRDCEELKPKPKEK